MRHDSFHHLGESNSLKKTIITLCVGPVIRILNCFLKFGHYSMLKIDLRLFQLLQFTEESLMEMGLRVKNDLKFNGLNDLL